MASAAGIGGAGIYVVVLMSLYSVGPHEAVPLAKALVFFGCAMTLMVSRQKKDKITGKPLVDLELVKNLVGVK